MPSPDPFAHLDAPRPCTSDGWEASGYSRPIWTPLGFIRRGDRYILTCRACGHAVEAPLQALVDGGRGDDPMHLFRWRCASCGGKDIAVSLDVAERKSRP